MVHWGDVGRATYLCLDCAEHAHKLNVSFVIHVNFDHAWAEHSPVTFIKNFTHATPSLAGQPLHKEEGSGKAPLLELFCWNAINVRASLRFLRTLYALR